jgi:hypothetical protein
MVSPRLMIRSLRKGTIAWRSQEWVDRLCTFRDDHVPAAELYSGDHWSVVRSLSDVAVGSGLKANVWICSAGYGLVGLGTSLKPYSATYSPTHPDSVCQNVCGLGADGVSPEWWRLISAWCGPERKLPRTIRELAADRPRTPIWVVASEIYLRAVADDLRNAVRCLADPDLLAIFSVGTATIAGLSDHLVPGDARFQTLLGGARRSLNIRLARMAMLKAHGGSPRLSALKPSFDMQLAGLPKPKHVSRIAMSDDAVRDYIREELRKNPRTRYTPLLRRLRDDGCACEHRRFATLFAELQIGIALRPGGQKLR